MPEIFKMCLELSSCFMKPRHRLMAKDILTTKNTEDTEKELARAESKSREPIVFSPCSLLLLLYLCSFASLRSVLCVLCGENLLQVSHETS